MVTPHGGTAPPSPTLCFPPNVLTKHPRALPLCLSRPPVPPLEKDAPFVLVSFLQTTSFDLAAREEEGFALLS